MDTLERSKVMRLRWISIITITMTKMGLIRVEGDDAVTKMIGILYRISRFNGKCL